MIAGFPHGLSIPGPAAKDGQETGAAKCDEQLLNIGLEVPKRRHTGNGSQSQYPGETKQGLLGAKYGPLVA